MRVSYSSVSSIIIKILLNLIISQLLFHFFHINSYLILVSYGKRYIFPKNYTKKVLVLIILFIAEKKTRTLITFPIEKLAT